MPGKPKVLVTRKLPEAVEARIARDYDAVFNPDDRLHSTDELLRLCEEADAVLPCHTEHFTTDVIAPARRKRSCAPPSRRSRDP